MSPIITKIEPQKKNRQRYSLFSEDQFIIGVSEQTLVEFQIYQGTELSDNQIQKIKNHEEKISIRDQAWRYLARRAHSIKELRDKLLNKGYSADKIEDIISQLIERDHLNDRTFAEQFINDEITFKKNGPLLIKKKLQQKGIAPDLIDSTLITQYSTSLQWDNCLQLANKKRRQMNISDPRDQKSQVGNYLLQKGFKWDIVSEILTQLDQGDTDGQT